MGTEAVHEPGVPGGNAKGAGAVREALTTCFTDSKGRTWDLRIPFSERGFLRERGLDLARPAECVAAISRLMIEEPEKLVEIAYKLASEQRNTVSPEEFVKGLIGGECLYNLSTALCASVIDFFPNPPSERARLLTVLSGMLDPSTWTESSGKPPVGPAASTPAPEPSES